LRASLGITAIVQSALYLSRSGNPSLIGSSAAVLTAAAGAAIVAGFFTPLAGLLVGACAAGAAYWTTEMTLPTLFAIAIGIALACLGPGAFSVDAVLFGRREIIIPQTRPAREP